MSRQLTLTEELERLEQSITLTLQGMTVSLQANLVGNPRSPRCTEIDSNFNRAHRIVTTSILPLVEQYGEHSKAVWEATKV